MPPEIRKSLYDEAVEAAKIGNFPVWFVRTFDFTIPYPWRGHNRKPDPGRNRTGIIEIAGPPESGKTHILADLSDHFGDKIKIIPEFGGDHNVLPSIKLLKSFFDVSNPTVTADDVMLNLATKIEVFKNETRNSDDKLRIFERGPFDVMHDLFWIMSLAHSKPVSPQFEEDELLGGSLAHDPREWLMPDFWNMYWSAFSLALSQIESVDALILSGLSYPSAQKRRARRGTSPGYVTNPESWPSVMNSYERVYGLWAIANMKYGTGILALNGDKPYQYNFRKITNYLSKLIDS